MTPNASTHRPNRILIALAAAWVALSIAIGGTVAADPGSAEARPTPFTGDQVSR